ncbi:MAG: hypothetical protein JST26_04590 [Bacteroidetes bacterium]|nr:hypothetical protein [Bacteroidota bacterium]
MDIQATLNKYKASGNFFDPEYERDNELLSSFKASFPTLSKDQVQEFVNILNTASDIKDTFFVADMLYLYETFSADLFEPLINAAIDFKDPSFNRVFLRPCIRVFGVKAVADMLANKFNSGDIVRKLGVSNLLYHLRPQKNGDADKLHHAILKRAAETTNIIELYHYKLSYADRIKHSAKIPNNANDLVTLVKGNKEYEDLLFNKLGWAYKE